MARRVVSFVATLAGILAVIGGIIWSAQFDDPNYVLDGATIISKAGNSF